MKLLRKLGRTDGAEIAEAALVLPLVFMFLLGIVWFGRAFNIYSTITQAAERGALTAARPACATCLQSCAWQDGGGNDTHFPCDANVESAVYSVMDASGLNRSQVMLYIPAGLQFCVPPVPQGACTTTSNNITVCRSVVLNPTGATPQCGTIVSFQYPFQMSLPFTSLNVQQIVLKAQAQSQMEN